MSNPIGTSLPVKTNGKDWPVVVIGLGSPIRPRENSKPTPAGEITYASGCILMVERDGEASAQKSASVHVINPAPEGQYELGTKYRAEGRVYVQPYESNQRVALSITVERLVPVVENDFPRSEK